jgi:hypothetical protein
VEVAIVDKITGHISPTVSLSLLGVSHVVVDVGAPGGASGNFKNKVSIISLHGRCTSGGISLRGPREEEEVCNTEETVMDNTFKTVIMHGSYS